jgi:endonuclease/exonuclease/phosphatase family metal-dependent hydrolase
LKPAVIAAIATLLLVSPGTMAQEGADSCEPSFLAASYNIRLDTAADGVNAWSNRKDFLIGQIAILRPHILGMQEVLPHQRQELEQALSGYTFVGGGREDGRQAGEASPLAIDRASFALKASGMFWLSPTPEMPSLGWDASFKRVATWARLKRRSDGAALLAMKVHWDHQGLVARQESGKMIKNWLSRNLRKGEAVILMGDFNAEVAEESVRQLLGGSDGLVDTRMAATDGTIGPAISFNGFQPFPDGGELIDHIFTGADITVRRHGVIAQHENGRVASDHFPVVALIDLPSRRKLPACGRQAAFSGE